MLEDISPAVERALAVARQQSAAGVLNAVELFLALIADDEGRAAQVLVEAGADLAAVRLLAGQHPPLALQMPAILTGAREVAGERMEATVTGEFLLLGLLRTMESLHDPLRRAGVRIGQLLHATDLPPLPLDDAIRFDDPVEFVSAARVVDANANRAREALRVLDDYCRFVLDDAVLTGEVKGMRHALADLLARLPAGSLIESRETLRDVGTAISAGGELVRGSPSEVARINLKRLQEALRSLEEFGKLLSGDLAAGLEALRYRAYTVERALSIGVDARERLDGAALYVLLTGATCAAALDWTIREAAAGGADIFQLREKSLSDRDLLDRAINVRRWTRETGTLLIVNDRPDIARLAEADGVHLGQDDLSVKDARRILGTGPLIGVSTHTPEQVEQAVFDGATYIGVGPTFASSTKQFDALAGLEFVRAATAITTLPAFIIGGVTAENVDAAVAAGAKRVAVSAAICQADDPQRAAAILKSALR